MINIKKELGLLLCCVLLLLPLGGFCADTMPTEQTQTVTMQLEQYNRLKEITNQQEMQIQKLTALMNLLEQNSTQDKQTLITLQNQLDDCKTRLTNAQSLLEQQKKDLQIVNDLLTKNEASLQILMKQIKVLENKIATLRRQRDMWTIGFGILGAGFIFDKTR